VAVDGNYDDVNRLSSEIANEFGWAFVNINVRPFYSEVVVQFTKHSKKAEIL